MRKHLQHTDSLAAAEGQKQMRLRVAEPQRTSPVSLRCHCQGPGWKGVASEIQDEEKGIGALENFEIPDPSEFPGPAEVAPLLDHPDTTQKTALPSSESIPISPSGRQTIIRLSNSKTCRGCAGPTRRGKELPVKRIKPEF